MISTIQRPPPGDRLSGRLKHMALLLMVLRDQILDPFGDIFVKGQSTPFLELESLESFGSLNIPHLPLPLRVIRAHARRARARATWGK